LSVAHYYVRRDELVRDASSLHSYFGREGKGVLEKGAYMEVSVPRRFFYSSFIALFSKPAGDIVCPHFWEFKPLIGCPFNCSYCYLNGTFFGNKAPKMKNLADASRILDQFLGWADSQGLRVLLNAGELTDSLAMPDWTRALIEAVLPVLECHPNHKILLLTKGGVRHVAPLLEDKGLNEFFIIAFSVNPPRVSQLYEKGAAPPNERLEASKLLQGKGFTFRIRLDPIIPIDGWRIDYAVLIKMMLKEYGLKPERITIGSLRGLTKTLRFIKDREWLKYLDKSEKTGWGLKLNTELRIEIYTHIIKKLRENGYEKHIALCKETSDMWQKLVSKGLLNPPGTSGVWELVSCNCIL